MIAERWEYSLDGDWRLVLDPQDEGKQKHWFTGVSLPDSIAVRVPSVWDLWVPDYDGVGWYFKDFELPGDWSERYISLEFEAADYYAEVWLNGHRLGAHEGGYTPFLFDATKAVKTGSNLVAVRIIDPHGPEGYGDFLPKEIPCAKEHGYFTFAGIWGSVRLVAKSFAHVRDFFIQPDLRHKCIVVDVTTSESGAVRLQIEGTSFQTSGPPGKLRLDFPEFECWCPDQPCLYTLHCEMHRDEELTDSIRVRFGMREFTVKNNRFCLNNRPIFIKGVLHQPDYARSLAAPESLELARRELELAKAAGFNLIRLHIKTAPKITLELADELGLLLYEEPPIGWIQKSQWMKQRCEREVREMILRDRNHPSVVIWGMLNESGNAGYIVNGGAQLIKDDLCRLARSLDPTRLIIDDSGGVNATRESARLMSPYHDVLEVYDDLHIYQRAPVDREIQLYYQHSGDPDKLVFISEFGFGGMEDLPAVVSQYGPQRGTAKDARFLQEMLNRAQQGFAEREMERVFGDFSGFTAAARDLQSDAARYHVEALRANANLAGYCYTQLCDAGHEFCAGVLDRWRSPKPVFETLKEVQTPLRLILHADRTNLLPRQEVPVRVLLANDDLVERKADLSLQVVGPTQQVLWKKKRAIRLVPGLRELWKGNLAASGSAGTHQFVVRLMEGTKRLAESRLELYVFDPSARCDVEVHVLDPNEHWRQTCAAHVRLGGLRAPVHVVPPLANTIRAYPAAELGTILGAARDGAVALIFSPPDDWNEFADLVDPSVRATNKDAVGAFLGMYHYLKLHPVFEGLPSRGLMRQVYCNVVPPKTFLETSDEDICGTFDTTPIATGHYMMGETRWWGSDVLVQRYGSGRLVFTHLRILENLGKDPVANRLFINLVQHFSRRSIPSAGPHPEPQTAMEWLRKERESVRRWMVIGMFPNWGDGGLDAVYPPEKEIDFHASYPGWYRPLTWQSWFSCAKRSHLVDLQEAFTPVYEYYPRFDYGAGYAYAEFTSEKRQTVDLHLAVQDSMKVWLNGTMVHESRTHPPLDSLDQHAAPVTIKKGRNTLLVKVTKIPGQFRFSLDLVPANQEPLQIQWWR
ncbi:MAG: hypothetical protein HY706_05395 [Candidatus Hydrogenedentes bacterium]|nr:hypothetical protein [Candidatus Hydrogenedentota bacterium]